MVIMLPSDISARTKKIVEILKTEVQVVENRIEHQDDKECQRGDEKEDSEAIVVESAVPLTGP